VLTLAETQNRLDSCKLASRHDGDTTAYSRSKSVNKRLVHFCRIQSYDGVVWFSWLFVSVLLELKMSPFRRNYVHIAYAPPSCHYVYNSFDSDIKYQRPENTLLRCPTPTRLTQEYMLRLIPPPPGPGLSLGSPNWGPNIGHRCPEYHPPALNCEYTGECFLSMEVSLVY